MSGKKSIFIPLQQVNVEDPFFSPIRDTVIRVMIPYQERVMKDRVPEVRESHVIRNFRIAAGEETGQFYGFVFQDSDLAKWLEAVAYSLIVRPDKDLEARADELIRLVEAVQQEDGYLNTYFTVAEPARRWDNLADCHELYCAGHLTEAAVAYYQATGKDRLLKVATRLCDHIDRRFGPGKTRGIPGHPEIELALMRLYHLTGEVRYRDLAKYFIDERGSRPDYFEEERENSDWKAFDFSRKISPYYMQNHLPLREQQTVEGHAVRCMYLLTGAADLAGETGDEELLAACRRLWTNMVSRRMYVTGGIGSTHYGEAFTRDFDLPNESAYAETCASVGVCFFAKQLLEAEVTRDTADILELELYNGTISGMQLDGTKFFYINQLEADPAMANEAYGRSEYTPERIGWYNCACCPPNLARLMTSLGGYLWSESADTLYSHLFIGNTVRSKAAGGALIRLTGNYPWDGEITYTVEELEGEAEFTLAIRHPGWCPGEEASLTLKKAGETSACPLLCEEKAGYWHIRRTWRAGDQVILHLELKPRRVYADPRVKADAGCVALMRGPMVYTFEGIDNGEDLAACRISRDAPLKALPFDQDLLGGIIPLKVEGCREEAVERGTLYGANAPREAPVTLTAIPYYAWCNRGRTPMRVWMRE